mgnify:CR=1 FL=1
MAGLVYAVVPDFSSVMPRERRNELGLIFIALAYVERATILSSEKR